MKLWQFVLAVTLLVGAAFALAHALCWLVMRLLETVWAMNV